MHYLIKVLEAEGHIVKPEDKILDFGCGAGNLVKSLRNDGYNAYGCDVKFKDGKHTKQLEEEGIISKIRMDNYRLPYEDNSFDYVVSETVFEHVQNIDETIKELARVMKDGAVALHCFPSKWCPHESHVYVPMSSVFRSYPYLLFWALLGIRKKSQKGLSAKETALMNKEYLENCTNYLSVSEVKNAFKKYFSKVEFVEETVIKYSPSRITVILGNIFSFLPFLPFLYRHLKAYAVITVK